MIELAESRSDCSPSAYKAAKCRKETWKTCEIAAATNEEGVPSPKTQTLRCKLTLAQTVQVLFTVGECRSVPFQDSDSNSALAPSFKIPRQIAERAPANRLKLILPVANGFARSKTDLGLGATFCGAMPSHLIRPSD